jgi:hypothetical protein
MVKLLRHIHTGPENPAKALGFGDSLLEGFNTRFAMPTPRVATTGNVDWVRCD